MNYEGDTYEFLVLTTEIRRWFADLVENVEGKVFDIRSNFCILVFQPISSSAFDAK